MVNRVMIRAALVVLSVCLASSAAADAYHPDIVKSQVVKLDAKSIEANANSGKPIDFVFDDTKLTVVLSPAPVWPKEGLTVIEVAEDGSTKKSIVKAANITYAGDVVGEDPDESEARFTISGGVVDGYVMSSTGWWFIEPLTRFDPKAGSDQYLVYATRDLDFPAVDYGDDGVKADEVTGWAPPQPSPNLEIPVVMVADREYVFIDPSPVIDRQASLINRVNGIYGHQTGRTFKIVMSSIDLYNGTLKSSNAYALNMQLKCFIKGQPANCTPGSEYGSLNSMNVWFAHLTTGKVLTSGTDFRYGIGDEDGRFGLSQQSARVSLSAQNTMVASHEIGHNFGGRHYAADHICLNGNCGYTLMWPQYYASNLAYFSDGLHAGKDNRTNIRNFMAAHGFF